MNKKNGFTLIELLVVVAIIGILASVVLASLNSARAKGADAKVKAQLASIRAAAELYYNDNSSYGPLVTDCTSGMFADTTSGMASLLNVNNYPSGTRLDCGSSPTAWSVAASLNGSTSDITGPAWCVDSTGLSTGTRANGTSYIGIRNSSPNTAHIGTGAIFCWRL